MHDVNSVHLVSKVVLVDLLINNGRHLLSIGLLRHDKKIVFIGYLVHLRHRRTIHSFDLNPRH